MTQVYYPLSSRALFYQCFTVSLLSFLEWLQCTRFFPVQDTDSLAVVASYPFPLAGFRTLTLGLLTAQLFWLTSFFAAENYILDCTGEGTLSCMSFGVVSALLDTIITKNRSKGFVAYVSQRPFVLELDFPRETIYCLGQNKFRLLSINQTCTFKGIVWHLVR